MAMPPCTHACVAGAAIGGGLDCTVRNLGAPRQPAQRLRKLDKWSETHAAGVGI